MVRLEHPGLIDKLVLIGTTHPRDLSLSDRTLPVLKIYGFKDGVADEADILANRGNLPATAEVARIEGANHAQFGYYGFQFDDNRATISRAEPQAKAFESRFGTLPNRMLECSATPRHRKINGIYVASVPMSKMPHKKVQ